MAARLATLDEYLGTPSPRFTREQLAAMGDAVGVPVRGRARQARGVEAPDHVRRPLIPPDRR